MNANCFRLLVPVLLASGLTVIPSRGGEDPPPVDRKQVAASQTNLKQVALAFLNFESAYAHFPDNLADKEGRSLLSWRVAILPFIEEDKLYKEFRLDEAWDSDHNKKLIPKMPKIYAPVRVKAKEGETFYQVFRGENAFFGGKAKNPKLLSITDGTSNTGLVFEAGEPVIWTKPADLPFDEKKPLPKLGGLFDGEFNVVLCDGSVMRVRKGADEKELKKLIMPRDGNVIDVDKLKR